MLTLMLVGAISAAGQVEQEDLELDEPVIAVEIENQYRAAVELFGTIDMADSIPIFERVIAALEPLATTDVPEISERLRASYVYVARAHHNFGDIEATQSVLERLVELAPGFELDRDTVSPKLAELFDSVRNSLIGFVELLIEPADSEVLIGNRVFRPNQGPQTILAGSYVAQAERPGFEPATIPFEIAAGKTQAVEAKLERSSAVIIVRTRPSGAAILVDGVELGRTTGEAETAFTPGGELASFPRSQFSSELMIDEIQLGTHRLEVHADGYRPYRGRLEVDETRDVRLQPIVLEEESGTVALNGLPDGAEVFLNDQKTRPQRIGSAAPQLVLPPGSYRLRISRGTSGIYETSFDVTDRGVVNLAVELRPALALLGILGKDDVAGERLESGLVDSLQKLGDWALLDRTLEAKPLLNGLGLTAASLRPAPGASSAGDSPDWARVQSTFDEQLPAAVYLLAVLSDDLLAKEADLWIWPSSPGPSRPERRRIEIDHRDFDRLAAAFRPVVGRVKPVLGLSTIDSSLARGPVVASLVPQGPAEQSGIRLGDEILGLGGSSVATTAQFEAELAKITAGASVEIEIARGGRRETKSIPTGRSYRVVDLADPGVVYAALSAALAAELGRESEWPRWVLQLNQAGILLRAGDHVAAVRLLNRIDATSMPGLDQPGLGRGHLEYWLGLALTQAGARYTNDARDAFERAASAQGGRLYADDGPLVAPRALARLGRLGGAP